MHFRKHTTRAEYQAMITWLENKANFALITGAAAQGQRLTSGQKLRKLGGCRSLTQYVNRKVYGTEWDEKAGKSRYDSYLATYKKTRAKSKTTGFGLTDADRRAYRHTIDAKLVFMCPFFNIMDNLFGIRQNVNPTHISALGLPVGTCCIPRTSYSRGGSSTPASPATATDPTSPGPTASEEPLSSDDEPEEHVCNQTAASSPVITATRRSITEDQEDPLLLGYQPEQKDNEDDIRFFPSLERHSSAGSATARNPRRQSLLNHREESGSETVSQRKVLPAKSGDDQSMYSDFASKRADIDRRRIELEEQRWSEEKELRREEMRARSKDLEQAGRYSMITELIKAGKSSEEIAAFMRDLNM
ncbi:hypothetical protein PsorP6_010501 [Peronosclerospora sorghi]|uniref:Uncharacterized protein n=1 Tax=Peronosclerospora sorghi TaxID=230839 RepID=A0ACC0VWQ5_9STRA|nr:hypothetical protein PsorP6_010501 [Peronosclerospora sorghi]